METIAVAAGQAALSALFDAIIRKLSSLSSLDVGAEVNQWVQFLKRLKVVLDDAEERQMSERRIKSWLDDLRDLTYDAEDILDEFSTEVLRQEVMPEIEASSSKVRKLFNTIKFNVSLESKMKEITQRFERITKEKEDLRLTERVPGGSNGVGRERLETTSLVPQIIGREKDKETLINELLSSDANGKPVSVVAIVGMGGLGKTTLAQLVYNDETVRKSFDIKVWVCVSDEFDVFKITVKIAYGFTFNSHDGMDLNSVQGKLKDAIHDKKFLLFLDDLWNENFSKWDALSQPLLAGGFGSKVLITTRNENIAATAGAGAVSMHRLKKLEPEECSAVLARHALEENDFSRHPWLQEVGKKMVEKCDGLPLAARALGGLLLGKSNEKEWREVLNSNIWELPQDTCDILPALRVSYHYLPSHLKRCFAYCAIFPKDYLLDKDDLIMWWMTQGFLEQSKNVHSNFMEVGNEYFNDLLSRSFFQPSTSANDSIFVMHDLMNDLAMWISGGICLHLPRNEESNDNIEFEKLRHLSFIPRRYEVAKRFEKFSSSMKLRSFIILSYYSTHFSNAIFDKVIGKMKCLTLLCLKRYQIKEVPHSISELKQLRHLDMSFTMIRLLPESISDLLNLQVLKLNNCWNLIQLPQDIRKLINLRLLDISKTSNLKEMPSGICCLTNLQILTKFIVGENHGLRLKELKGLSLIGEELSIWGLEKVVDIQEARDANLKAKNYLISMNFNWKEETSALENEKQVQILDELQPHSNLKSLEISGYNGKRFSKWVGQSSFTNLETLHLGNCRSASLLPPLGEMSSLKKLIIDGMHEVKNVGKEFLGNTANSFPSLETLILERMNALKEWCSGPWSGEEARVEFPQLKELVIKDCPMLAGKLPNYFPLLEELSIFRCPMLVALPNRLPLLGKLKINKCSMLAGLPNELPLLGKLSINTCSNLTNLECKHPSLRELNVRACSGSTLMTLTNLNSLVRLKLKKIRELNYMDDGLVRMLGKLQELEIVKCRELKTLVSNGKGIEGMVGLKTLIIRDCDELEALVVVAGETELNYLPSLETLDIKTCDKLASFGPMRLPSSLKEMKICECDALKCLPEGFMMDGSNTCEFALEKLSILFCPSLTNFSRGRFPDQLVDLTIDLCPNLESMPKFSNSIKSLNINRCDHIQTLPRFPVSVKRLKIRNLESLALGSTAIEKAMSISSDRENVQYQLPSQEYIEIGNVEELEPRAEKMFDGCSSSLEVLVIEGLDWRKLPKNMTSFQTLKNLEIENCRSLKGLPKQIQKLTCLRELTIMQCPNLELLAGHDLPGEVKVLRIYGCEKVTERLFKGGLSLPASLTHLEIGVGVNIKLEAPVFLPNLCNLRMSNFGNLESLAAAFQLPSSIKELYIGGCPRLVELPIHELSSDLHSLKISRCPLLKKRCLDRKGEYWPKLSIIPQFLIDWKDVFLIGEFE